MDKMEALYERVCGLDVHKQSVVACRRRLTSSGRIQKEVCTFGTTPPQLWALLAWR
jgi:transposase